MNKESEKVLEEYFNKLEVLNEVNKNNIVGKLESEFTTLYEHLLKFKFHTNNAGADWVKSIYDSNTEILDVINESKNNYNILMRDYTDEILSSAYNRAKSKAAKRNNVDIRFYPKYYYENEDLALEYIIDKKYLKQYILEHLPNNYRKDGILDTLYKKFKDVD